MNDIRFRIGAATLLSLAAFLSVAEAALAFVWWLIFTSRFRNLPGRALIIGSLSVVAVVATILQLMQGTGISYGIRMGAVILIAAWLWSEYRSGEMLDFSVWALGQRRGFDLGLVAELSMQAFLSLLADCDRMKTAWAIKGMSLTPANIPAAGTLLVRCALVRAKDTGELLAVRGYREGGTICPVFPSARSDIVAAGAAVAVFIAVVLTW